MAKKTDPANSTTVHELVLRTAQKQLKVHGVKSSYHKQQVRYNRICKHAFLRVATIGDIFLRDTKISVYFYGAGRTSQSIQIPELMSPKCNLDSIVNAIVLMSRDAETAHRELWHKIRKRLDDIEL